MTEQTPDQADLGAALAAPHERALHVLEGPRPRPLDAVAWLSAHLAAVDRVLYPLARQLAPDGRAAVRDLCAIDRRLQHVLWRLDRRSTGDMHVAQVPLRPEVDRLRTRLAEHAAAEGALLAGMIDGLSPAGKDDLARRLATAMAHAPTRPHPYLPHVRFGADVLFHVDALVDHLRDALDARPVPTPHDDREPVAPGRLGTYLLGGPAGLGSWPRRRGPQDR